MIPTANQVIEALVKFEKNKTPAYKANATRLLNKYVENRVYEGYGEKGVRAAIKAHVTRRISV